MPCFTTCTQLAASPSAVFDAIVDLSRWSSFRGYGPLPGIVRASLPEGECMREGARVRVENTDGTVHHEVVRVFEPGRRYVVRMEVSPSAARVLRHVDETVELEPTAAGGTEMRRTFEIVPRAWFTTPLCWLVARGPLRRAVDAHNREAQTAFAARAST